MEGVNLGAFLLWLIAVGILFGAAVVAVGLLLAGWKKAARIVFASGMFATFLISSLATFSFLEHGMGFHAEGEEPYIALLGAAQFVAGVGQFVGGLRSGRAFAWSAAWAIGSILVLMLPLGSPDFLGGHNIALPVSETVLAAISLAGAVISLACGIFIPAARQLPDSIAD